MKILLVEDDVVIAATTKNLLTQNGMSVVHVSSAREAKEELVMNEYDCALIDRGLPDQDGLEIIREVRQQKVMTPILVLTAYSQSDQIIAGLDTGADDYLAKPFEVSVLMARIRALIRRGPHVSTPVLVIGQLKIDTNSHIVTLNDQVITLSPKEYSLLEYMAHHPTTALDRITLLTHAWDDTVDLFSNTVDVHIRYLRKKLGKNGQNLIRTIKGKGYMLCGE